MAERRYTPRMNVVWEAECQTPSGELLVGTIRDAHTHGFFFTPEEELAEGELFGSADTDSFEPGRSVILTFMRSSTNAAERMLARLRWHGRSAIHGCTGWGIEVLR